MITDALGHVFDPRKPPRRVVSLVPSLTETLFELEVGKLVVGITDFCIFPESLELPRVGGTKNPRVEEIRRLRPDLVYVNLEENLRRHADAIAAFAAVHASEPKSVEDVIRLITDLGAIHHREKQASALTDAIGAELRAMPRRPFTFACPIWKDPWMWCGGDTYVSQLVQSAGGRNVLEERARYPQIALEDVLTLRPELVFLPDEPYAFTAADAAAFRGTEVVGPFPGHLFTWHGSRTILGLRWLREALETHGHPGYAHFAGF